MFASYQRDEDWQIYGMDTSGKNLTRLTNANGLKKIYFILSPKGKRILWGETDCSIQGIVDTDGSNRGPVFGGEFSFSYDDQKLLFVNGFAIYSVELRHPNSVEAILAYIAEYAQIVEEAYGPRR